MRCRCLAGWGPVGALPPAGHLPVQRHVNALCPFSGMRRSFLLQALQGKDFPFEPAAREGGEPVARGPPPHSPPSTLEWVWVFALARWPWCGSALGAPWAVAWPSNLLDTRVCQSDSPEAMHLSAVDLST